MRNNFKRKKYQLLGIAYKQLTLTTVCNFSATGLNRGKKVIFESNIIKYNGQMQVKIEVIEPLGKETLVRSNLINSNLILNLNTSPSDNIKRGEIINIKLDLDRLYFFDTITGDRLMYG